jgi:hypothetical protein
MEEHMRRLFSGSLVGLGLAILLAAPVAAGSESTDSRQFERGRLASAFDGECRESADGRRVTCKNDQVNIFDGRRGGSEPEFRFAGEEVCVSRYKNTFNPRTGRSLSDTLEQGCARNRRSLDVDFGEQLRWASVAGTIKLQRERCVYSGDEPTCESDERRVALDLYWDGQGPITEVFSYYRATRKNCEFTFTGTVRSRDATVRGDIGTKPVRLDGEILRRDVQQTLVCT